MTLKICEEGEVHFPGGFIADTETLCGFGSCSTKDTKRKRITCAACLEIIANVRGYTEPTPEQPAAQECPNCGYAGDMVPPPAADSNLATDKKTE